MPQHRRPDRPSWDGPTSDVAPRPHRKLRVSHPVCSGMRPVRTEVEVWNLGLGVPGQHSALTPNLCLRREGGSQPLLLKRLATFPSCFIFLIRNLAGELELGARGRWSYLAPCDPQRGPQYRTIAPRYLPWSQCRALSRCPFMPPVGSPRWVGVEIFLPKYGCPILKYFTVDT